MIFNVLTVAILICEVAVVKFACTVIIINTVCAFVGLMKAHGYKVATVNFVRLNCTPFFLASNMPGPELAREVADRASDARRRQRDPEGKARNDSKIIYRYTELRGRLPNYFDLLLWTARGVRMPEIRSGAFFKALLCCPVLFIFRTAINIMHCKTTKKSMPIFFSPNSAPMEDWIIL